MTIEKAIFILDPETPWSFINEKEFDDACRLAIDALKYMQEHKGYRPFYGGDEVPVCGNCKYFFDKTYSVCPKCGKRVDWNG